MVFKIQIYTLNFCKGFLENCKGTAKRTAKVRHYSYSLTGTMSSTDIEESFWKEVASMPNSMWLSSPMPQSSFWGRLANSSCHRHITMIKIHFLNVCQLISKLFSHLLFLLVIILHSYQQASSKTLKLWEIPLLILQLLLKKLYFFIL